MTAETAADPRNLKPGDHHYQAFVGPPGQYDFMGATQFRLLCSLGLRAHHRLLDFGCGSLRAGRLFIPYLDADRYCGVEPNRWLIEDAVANQLGRDLLEIKRPRFAHNDDFTAGMFGDRFDFIIAQSIFSHTGPDLTAKALASLGASLGPEGLLAATFVEGRRNQVDNGWVYPDCVAYRPARIKRFAREAGLFAVRLPWYHPRQTWYLFAREKSRLPGRSLRRHLRGAVLLDPEFAESWRWRLSLPRTVKGWLKQLLP